MVQIIDKKITVLTEPFPHLIAENFYDEEELKLIWEVLDSITEEQKFLPPGHVHGASAFKDDKLVFLTNHKAIRLNDFYNEQPYSNIFKLFKKKFDHQFTNSFVDRFPQFLSLLDLENSHCLVKARYYADGEYYKPHTDYRSNYAIFTYFNKQPKKYTGGELYFPQYGNYHFKCEHNTIILTPAYVKHSVKKVNIDQEDYDNNFGRYAITYFIGMTPSPIYLELSNKWKIKEWDVQTNNINQIYHTSHCGSTLMTTLLRFSCDAYSEPPWLRSALTEKNSEKEFNKILSNQTDCVIKFPSIYCSFSNCYPGKKVFLYRNLSQHLTKIMSLDDQKIRKIVSQVDSYYEQCIHPSVKKHSFVTDIEKITAMWVSRILYLMKVEDVLWIKTNDFLSDKEETMKLVCNHFNIPDVTDFSISNYYVKDVGFKPGIEVPLEDINPDLINKDYVDSSFGIIDDKTCNYNYDIEKSILFVRENFPTISNKLLV